MQQPDTLTLEQQFSLRSFEAQVDRMSVEQAHQYLVKLCEHMMVREAMWQDILKHSPATIPPWTPPTGDLS